MKGLLTVQMLISLVKFTVQLAWNTNMLSSACCQGNNQLLMWNYTNGANERITELQWFFNDTTLICLYSKTLGFHVTTLYDGRIQRTGNFGILLFNVSLKDAGEYTLYMKLDEETEPNVQGISLTVVEQLPYECKPTIEKHSNSSISCSTSCGSSWLSVEWIMNGPQDPVGIERYLFPHTSWTSEPLFCCLRGWKCHVEERDKFCTAYSISFTKDVDTINESEISPAEAPNCECTKTTWYLPVIIALFNSLIISACCQFITRYKQCIRRHSKSSIAERSPEESKLLEDKAACEPCTSSTCQQFSEDLLQNHTAAAIIARPVSDSKPHVQKMSTIKIDEDCLKDIIAGYRYLLAEVKVARKETRLWQLKIRRYKYMNNLRKRRILGDENYETTK